MPRGKNRLKILLDSSQATLFAGIEIHNKPLMQYRYQTSIMLIMNAWELILKAYIYKYIGKRKIYEEGSLHTITFSKALKDVKNDINTKKGNSNFEAVASNLYLLSNYRNNLAHFGNDDLDGAVFMLINKAVLNYDSFIKEYFNKDITKRDNLILLPIGFRSPIDPVEFLRKRSVESNNDFIKSIIDATKALNDKGITDTIIVGFDFHMISAKKANNADIIAAIAQENPDVLVACEYRITDNPHAPEVRISQLPPLTYKDLQKKLKEQFATIIFGRDFNLIMHEINNDESLCKINFLDPKKPFGTKKRFYKMDAVKIIIEKYKACLVSKETHN